MMFLLTSPQYLADNKEFLNTVLAAHCKQSLQFVAFNEDHLYAMHGRYFRESIWLLTKVLFAVLFHVDNDYTPLFLAMNATTTIPLIKELSKLTTITWNSAYPRENMKQD